MNARRQSPFVPRVSWRLAPLALLAAVIALCFALGTSGPARAAEPAAEAVSLPLVQWSDLVERARAAELSPGPGASPSAAIASRQVAVAVDGDTARLESSFEIDARGRGGVPVDLPVAGRIEEVSVDPRAGTSLSRAASGELTFVAPAPGRYRVVAVSRVAADPGTEVFAIPTRATEGRIPSPVVEVRLDLPADLAWDLAGAVPLENLVAAGRRRVRLAPARGSAGVVTVRRGSAAVSPSAAASAVARAVVITHLDLRGDEVVRTDTVLVEVLRGELASLEARIPDGLRVESARMDDGGEVAVTGGLVSGRRKQRLSGNGFLKLVSRLSGPPAATMPLSAVEPAIPVRARYLVVSSSVAASLRPVPAEAWSTIDLTDPPDSLERELQERPPVGGWRLEAAGARTALEVALLPPVDLAPRPISGRVTRTFASADGSLLIQDRFRIEGRPGALALTLPPGLRFESATVDGDVVRPIERDGRHLIPLVFHGPGEAAGGSGAGDGSWLVEVALTDRPLLAREAGEKRDGWGARRRTAHRRLELPAVDGEVLRHEWEVYLPPGLAARSAGGDLRPVPSSPSPRRRAGAKDKAGEAQYFDFDAVEELAVDGVTVTAESPLLDSKRSETGYTASQAELEKIPTARDPWDLLQKTPGVLADRIDVGGNEAGQSSFYRPGTAIEGRPSFVASAGGAVLRFAAALPPRQVAVELEVRETK